ncbi:hypothetical protein PENSPDRAFT_739192 [Peniophora sp. CONT]|nr:hypothetical protein PENSPDRAFT_739192 [Peniophora sp. CONT]
MSTHRVGIANLPVEVLAMVFECYHTTATSDAMYDGHRSLFRLSHVCRTWRHIILACRALWASNVDASDRTTLSQVVLERAGSRTLDIRLMEITPRFAKNCLPEWLDTSRQARTRSINLQCFGNRASDTMVKLIGSNLPLLRSLEIHCYTADDELEAPSHPDDEPEDEVIIETLSIEHAPALTRVVLENCLLRWDADIYSHLTHLEISVNRKALRKFHNPAAQYPTHARMSSIISSLHHIVDLKLDIFPRYVERAERPQPIPVSPSCQRVELRSLNGHNHCCWFASSLVVPPSTALTIVQVSEGNTARILSEFSRAAQAMSISTIGSVGNDYLGTVVVDAGDVSPWTQPVVPTDLLHSIPGGHVTLHFEYLNINDVVAEEEEEENIVPSCKNMFRAISQLDFNQLKALQIPGLRYSDENERRFVRNHAAFLRALADAEKVEVFILPKANASLLRALAKPSTVTGGPQFPLLSSVIVSLWPGDTESLTIIRDWLVGRHNAKMTVITLHVLLKLKDYETNADLWQEIGHVATLDTCFEPVTPKVGATHIEPLGASFVLSHSDSEGTDATDEESD